MSLTPTARGITSKTVYFSWVQLTGPGPNEGLAISQQHLGGDIHEVLSAVAKHLRLLSPLNSLLLFTLFFSQELLLTFSK